MDVFDNLFEQFVEDIVSQPLVPEGFMELWAERAPLPLVGFNRAVTRPRRARQIVQNSSEIHASLPTRSPSSLWEPARRFAALSDNERDPFEQLLDEISLRLSPHVQLEPFTRPPEHYTTPWMSFRDDELFRNNMDFEDVAVTCDQDTFDKLTNMTVDESNRFDGKECNICLNTYSIGEHVTTLPCEHMFHQDCVKEWLCNRKKTCPVCRSDVMEAAETT